MASAVQFALISSGALAGAWAVWRLRERRMFRRRKAARALHALIEEVVSSSAAEEILSRLNAALPGIFRITDVRVYLYDRAERALRPAAGADSAVSLCFRNRTPLAASDLLRRPEALGAAVAGPARAVLLAPMLRRGEAAGVLEMMHASEPRKFSSAERAAVQHLANLVAATLRRIEQQSIREQVLLSERLGGETIGRLLSVARADSDAGEPAAVVQGSAPARPLTLLLIESDETEARRILSLVAGRGHRVVPVASGEEAMELSRRFGFDAVMCDPRLLCMNEELNRAVAAAGGQVLAKSAAAEDLDRALSVAASRLVVE
ncbi:MAG: GAF domain-containing protein [Acidobacteria bacterium]|nr:GAF domain-containing protein [Acidobacteriota bacterium]